MIKKLFVMSFAVLMLTFSAPIFASAAAPGQITAKSQGDVMPTAELTQWVIRINEDGVTQKRLWSITYGVWLTDWIDVE